MYIFNQYVELNVFKELSKEDGDPGWNLCLAALLWSEAVQNLNI